MGLTAVLVRCVSYLSMRSQLSTHIIKDQQRHSQNKLYRPSDTRYAQRYNVRTLLCLQMLSDPPNSWWYDGTEREWYASLVFCFSETSSDLLLLAFFSHDVADVISPLIPNVHYTAAFPF